MNTYSKTVGKLRVRTRGKTQRGDSLEISPGSKTAELLATNETSRIFYIVEATTVAVASGTYQKNGAGGFISTATSSVSGDFFELRLPVASDEYGTSSVVTLTADGTPYIFTVTTALEAFAQVNPDLTEMLNPDGSSTIQPT
jgi:hypothetical protein